MNNDKRPPLTRATPVNDFLDYYWLKEELIDFCARHGLKTSGGKIEITGRIAHFLQTGRPPVEQARSRASSYSADDQPLVVMMDAPITKNYNSGERVRGFFKSVIGPHFHFTVGLMKFCKDNPTKTFRDAVQYWQDEYNRKSDKSYQPEIAPQFEYNQYIRDFMTDNPGASLKEAIWHWKQKRSARGDNKYSRDDLAYNSSDTNE
ncbi:DUF6434 domain-containing protein [Spirosoma fluviale]|uniref:DUF6434 domain-containing protein n=1 Tax=Spirosoma fluviale TaxID=1597977 RepID=A0A286GUG8_9BACT|nr:DUF6434 domain-containing protein [Spirosoma fluviale]SOD99168.1 hypothetical protein SAMN06269250_6299 [Spirosoma fluviale]